ncbi:MAG: helicase-related protein [Gordonia amarae]
MAASRKVERPDPDRILSGLKDFQRSTVEHVFRRLWLDEDCAKNFLVADEVGLGKTMVAKGIIAKTVDHLSDDRERIDIVYICSNAQIAAQNLQRLSQYGVAVENLADRLTNLPMVADKLAKNRVNMVSFTPANSFDIKRRTGRADERVVILRMLAGIWEIPYSRVPRRWFHFFRCASSLEGFESRCSRGRSVKIDPAVVKSFGERLKGALGPQGGSLESEVRAGIEEFANAGRGRGPSAHVKTHRNRLIGFLRTQLAYASIQCLEPSLIILDEFQRYKEVVGAGAQGGSDASELAGALIETPAARTVLLSATPYKMYTLPGEASGDDHYADLFHTLRFLGGETLAKEADDRLRALRKAMISREDPEGLREVRDAAASTLRKVMCRTERTVVTPGKDAMVQERPMADVKLKAEDIRSWISLEKMASALGQADVFEYWRSTPYPLSMMDRTHYNMAEKFQSAVEQNNELVLQMLPGSAGILQWSDIRKYCPIDPGNAKMRGLVADVLDRGAWKIVWLRPSLPYYALSGEYASPELEEFTKRLIFSAWNVVPKAIAMMLSYEAERRTIERGGRKSRDYADFKSTRPLSYRLDRRRPRSMSVLTLMYPSVVLANLGDPLSIAQERNSFATESRVVLEVVGRRIKAELDRLGARPPKVGPVDHTWYWAAPLLLDRLGGVAGQDEFEIHFGEVPEAAAGSAGLAQHVKAFKQVHVRQLGRMPDDLIEVLALVAVASPAIVALRALSRVCGLGAITDVDARNSAFGIATQLRRMFNRPEIVALLRGDHEADGYWRAVLQHSVEGCLQSVLDEYFHGLVESKSMVDLDLKDRARGLYECVLEALRLDTGSSYFGDFKCRRSSANGPVAHHGIRTQFAVRYGRDATADGGSDGVEMKIREAFNSPFRPFVLASTSVGQEGLDFHTYCHAVVHWNLPGNPVDLEQREGRVHRYKGHAVRKNVALRQSEAALRAGGGVDPWAEMFNVAAEGREPGDTELSPYWIYPHPNGAYIERYVPAMPLSREVQKYGRLLRTVGGYRMVFGQPRQEDLLKFLDRQEIDIDAATIDLRPPPADRS